MPVSVRFGLLCGLAVLAGGCARPRGQQLCEAIAKRDVKTVEQLLDGPAINMTIPQGSCVPAAAVFGVAAPDDKVLTSIGVALVAAGLPADAYWIAPGRAEPVRAVEAAASNGNAELEGTLGNHRDQSSEVQAIVSYFAATNLTTILAQSTPFGLNIREPALLRLLGAPPKEAEALAKLASPVFQVDRADPPLMLFHGDQDPQMPINQSHELEGAYEQQGLQVDFIVVHGAAHGGDAFYSADNVERVVTFLGAQLRRGAAASAVPAPGATAADRI